MEDKREEVVVKEKEHKKAKKLPLGSILHVFWTITSKIITLVIVLICIIISVQKVTENRESFFGYRIFRVQTGSMIPKYNIGDVILVREKDEDKIKVGDDVTYKGESGSVKGLIVTHRVKEIEEIDGKLAFHTQGIANNLEDPIVYGKQINGVVQTKMYFLTLICTIFNNKYVFYFCGIIPLSIYAGFRIFKGRHDKDIEREN